MILTVQDDNDPCGWLKLDDGAVKETLLVNVNGRVAFLQDIEKIILLRDWLTGIIEAWDPERNEEAKTNGI